MAVSGFSLLLAAVAALAGLMAVAHPVRGEEGPAQPAATLRLTDVPDDELSETLQPSETPPPDFRAVQYIDSAGCVFLRTDRGWRARIARDRAPICGYPPTLSARRTGPVGAMGLFPEVEEPTGQRIQRELAEAIIPNLRAGEMVAGKESVVPESGEAGGGQPALPNAAPVSAEGLDHPAHDSLRLGDMLAGAPELTRQMMRGRATDRLCALLGTTPKDPVGSALGICGTSAIALSAAAQIPDPGDRVITARATAKKSGAPGTRDHAQGLPATAKPQAITRKAQATAEPRDDPRMIPPGARYVQVGAFRDSDRAERAARELAALGLPVVRSRKAEGQAQLVLVGPLDGREAIVHMIDRLGHAGYHDVVARR